MNNRLFGERLAALRKEKGMTQAQLAEILNVSNKTISRWEMQVKQTRTEMFVLFLVFPRTNV